MKKSLLILPVILSLTIMTSTYFSRDCPSSAKIVDQIQNSKNKLEPTIIKATGQKQTPELYNGCEVTSLSMLLAGAGHPVDKQILAEQIAKDQSPRITDMNGNVISWGNPDSGFVGDITGTDPGYGVYHEPVAKLLNDILPGKGEDLTGKNVDIILNRVAAGMPVMVWTTVRFQPTSSWVTWEGANGPVVATFDEHAVLLVGFDDQFVYVNDPLDGSVSKPVDRKQFFASWEQLGKQAITIN